MAGRPVRRRSGLEAPRSHDDPATQLQQAITDAQRKQQRLLQQAATLIAHQKQAEAGLARTRAESLRLEGSTREAIRAAEEARAAGDDEEAGRHQVRAKIHATQLAAARRATEDLAVLSAQSAETAQQATVVLQGQLLILRRQLAERQHLLGQLRQAEAYEALNQAVATESAGRPGGFDLDRVRAEIQARYLRATSASELALLRLDAGLRDATPGPP